MNMNAWVTNLINDPRKKPFPLLSYPSVQLMEITVTELVRNPLWQAMGMRLIADKYQMPAALSYMDLSVEAEAFGACCVYEDTEVPNITGTLIETAEQAEALEVPEVGAGRTGICVEAIKKAKLLINDRPIFANCIGPYSLAGRLLNVNDVMLMCYEEPEVVHTVLRKATDFIKKYVGALKEAGANGVILAEPLAGILSPDLMQEFSTDYVKEIVKEHDDSSFLIIYHNCGSAVGRLLPQVLDTGCRMFHFGDYVNLKEILTTFPEDKIVMGNISPSTIFNGTNPRGVHRMTQKILLPCSAHRNFLISSGCDIPPETTFENIDMFFDTVNQHYYKQMLYDMMI